MNNPLTLARAAIRTLYAKGETVPNRRIFHSPGYSPKWERRMAHQRRLGQYGSYHGNA